MDFDAALAADPRNIDALCGRGLARAHLGHVSEAAEDAETALKQVRTRRVLWNVACIYGQALTQLAPEGRVKPRSKKWHQAVACEDRALRLLRELMNNRDMSPSQASRFWQETVLRQSPA